MDAWTYLVIALCYGAGCVFSYRLGQSHGMDYAIGKMATEIAEISNSDPQSVLIAVKEHRAKKALKS